MGLLDILKGPVTGLVSAVGGVIDKLTTTQEEKLAAKAELLRMTQQFQLEMERLNTDWAKAQRDVIVAEASGHSWLQRNWRPMVMLAFVFLIGVVVWTGGYINGRELDRAFVLEILSIIKIGLGGYVIGRSVEKTAPAVAEIFKKNNKK